MYKLIEVPVEDSFDAQSFDLALELDEGKTQDEASLPCGCTLELTEFTVGFTFCDSHRRIAEEWKTNETKGKMIQRTIDAVRMHLDEGDPIEADSELSLLTVALRGANAPIEIVKLAEKALEEVQLGSVEKAETYLDWLEVEARKT